MVSIIETHIDLKLNIASWLPLWDYVHYTPKWRHVTWSSNEVDSQFLRLQNRVRRLHGHKPPFLSVSSTLPSSPYLPHTMSTLEIDAPAVHNFFFTPYGETYTPSLSGVISLPPACFKGKSTAPLVSVSLTQFVTLSTKRGAIPQLVMRKKQPGASYAEVVACAEVFRPTGAATANERDQALSLDFSLAVPTALSPTTRTSIMTTSYKLSVHAKMGGGEKLEATRELQIRRTMVPSTPLVFEHFRRFQRMPFSTRLFLSPEHLTNCTATGTFNGNVLLEGLLVQRGRPSEIKVVVVREVRWSVAEAVEISRKHPSSPLDAGPDKRYIGTICKGRIRGNWMPEDLVSWKEDEDAFKQVQVPFRLLAEKATSDMELHCPQPKRLSPRASTVVNEMSHEKISIFVSHRMRLEIFIGEDTFVQRTQTLVDRKPVRHCLGAIYPLHIGHIAYDAPITEELFESESELPRYEDFGRMLPACDV